MAVTVTYKGSTLTTLAANEIKTLKTAGKYMEGDVTLTDDTIDGNNLGYGYTDEGLPLAGVAQAGYASAVDPTLPAMSLGTGVVGTDRVV